MTVAAMRPVSWGHAISRLWPRGKGLGIAPCTCSIVDGSRLRTEGINKVVVASLKSILGAKRNKLSIRNTYADQPEAHHQKSQISNPCSSCCRSLSEISASNRPWENKPTRSQICYTWSRWWEENSTVSLLSSRNCRIRLMNSCTPAGSIPEVGSSKIITSGFLMSTSAKPRRWRVPPGIFTGLFIDFPDLIQCPATGFHFIAPALR